MEQDGSYLPGLLNEASQVVALQLQHSAGFWNSGLSTSFSKLLCFPGLQSPYASSQRREQKTPKSPTASPSKPLQIFTTIYNHADSQAYRISQPAYGPTPTGFPIPTLDRKLTATNPRIRKGSKMVHGILQPLMIWIDLRFPLLSASLTSACREERGIKTAIACAPTMISFGCLHFQSGMVGWRRRDMVSVRDRILFLSRRDEFLEGLRSWSEQEDDW